MSKSVSLFTSYAKLENQVTNYCLLILKMLYEENPKYLSEVVATICGESAAGIIGVSFRQQQLKVGSTPDGIVSQSAFTLYIETKNYDWFYNDQLEKHLAALNEESKSVKILMALGNFECDLQTRFSKINDICENLYGGSIVFSAVSFEDFVGALDLADLPPYLKNAVSELRAYLSKENLLPTWQDILDVVNCAGQPKDILEDRVYICPATGGSYSHVRAKFFGMYRNKTVQFVSEIEAVVDVDPVTDDAKVLWKIKETADSELVSLAKEKLAKLRSSVEPKRIFLLGELFSTDFKKDSPGGMFSSKIYFNLEKLKPTSAEELANKLCGKMWSQFT